MICIGFIHKQQDFLHLIIPITLRVFQAVRNEQAPMAQLAGYSFHQPACQGSKVISHECHCEKNKIGSSPFNKFLWWVQPKIYQAKKTYIPHRNPFNSAALQKHHVIAKRRQNTATNQHITGVAQRERAGLITPRTLEHSTVVGFGFGFGFGFGV